MVAKRITASTWLTLALAVVFQVAGCDGESTTGGGDDDSGGSASGARGGAMTGGKGGTNSLGGNSAGGSTTGGRGGTSAGGTRGEAGAPSGGQSQGGESQGGQPTAGEGGDAGQGADAGTGGSTPDPTVIGRVVDFWLQPLANVPVTIGSTTTTTNAQGVFTIPTVAPEYDASLIVSWPGGQAGTYAWRFEGLTRRDPTLQVRQGREYRYANYTLDPQNETLNASRTLWVTVASAYGANYLDGVAGSGVMTGASWEGPATTEVSAYGLLWELDVNKLPTVYRAFDSASTTLDEASMTSTPITLNLMDETIPSGSVTGTVTAATSTERANLVFVRFAGGAAIRVVNDYRSAPDSYNYVVPTLPASTITVAASEGNSFFGAFGIAHRDGLGAGQSAPALAVPAPATQVVPVLDATQFSWSGSAGTYVFHVESAMNYSGLYVVTSRRSITLGSIPGFALRAIPLPYWRVQKHGSAAAVDDVAGPQGYLDPFTFSDDLPYGPRSGSGSFSISAGRRFTWSN
jgi:hypothetical protein